MSFNPRFGQWVKVKLPEKAHQIADSNGVYRCADGSFIGLCAKEDRSQEGIITLPHRIVLVGEQGQNAMRILNARAVDLWLVYLPQDAGAAEVWYESGCLGSPDSLAPVVNRMDCPPGRRPEHNPRP